MGVLVGMIGLTHPHSAGYLRTLDALDRVDGAVLYDAAAGVGERIGRDYQKTREIYADLDRLLGRADVPVVVVTLPTDQVPDVVCRAARAGKQVICEKPCARSAAEFRPVLAALEESRTAFTTGYIWRANPSILKLRELIQAGALGRLTSVELRMVTTQVRLRSPSHWLFKREVSGGGILSWLGCHWLDLLRYVTGQEVTTVSALTETLSGEAIDVEDVASVSMRLTNGALASLYAGYLLPAGRAGYEGTAYDQSIILRGTEGTLRHLKDGDDQIVELASTAEAWRAAPRQTFRFTLPNIPAYGGVHGLAFIDEFIRRALAGEEPGLVTALDALRVLEILDAAYASAKSGERVEMARGQ